MNLYYRIKRGIRKKGMIVWPEINVRYFINDCMNRAGDYFFYFQYLLM